MSEEKRIAGLEEKYEAICEGAEIRERIINNIRRRQTGSMSVKKLLRDVKEIRHLNREVEELMAEADSVLRKRSEPREKYSME